MSFKFDFNEDEVKNMPITSLAFVGDAYFTLYARLKVLNTEAKSGKFHTKAIRLVNAHAQSEFLDRIKPFLSEEEEDLIRRARNTHTSSKSKNAGLADYKKSTAFEALLGFLFLTKNEKRIDELLNLIISEEKL